jgi:NADPH-dependent glutamate synthase beta subunit-like oxidoreductase
MWAAKIAYLRGHDVTLYEKESALGGQVAIAMRGAGREEFGVIIRNERNQLNALRVPVVLGQAVTPEFILSQDPDAVIVATGSTPKRPAISGGDGPRVFTVWQVLKGQADLGERVLFIDDDGGHQATSTVEYLADLGKAVHVITTAYYLGGT